MDRFPNMQSLKSADSDRVSPGTGLRNGGPGQKSGTSGRSSGTWNQKLPIQG